MAKKQKKKPQPEEILGSTKIKELILFGLFSLSSRTKKCLFARLLKECFELSPAAFSFSQYPNWPDARKLDRSLRALRQKKLIKGDPKTFFVLTKLGEREAKKIAQRLKQQRLAL